MENYSGTEDRDRLVKDLRGVVSDAENLVKATANDLGDKAKDARAKLMATLESAKVTLQEKAVAGARATDKLVRDNPYQSLGISFALGLLLGVVVTRK